MYTCCQNQRSLKYTNNYISRSPVCYGFSCTLSAYVGFWTFSTFPNGTAHVKPEMWARLSKRLETIICSMTIIHEVTEKTQRCSDFHRGLLVCSSWHQHRGRAGETAGGSKLSSKINQKKKKIKLCPTCSCWGKSWYWKYTDVLSIRLLLPNKLICRLCLRCVRIWIQIGAGTRNNLISQISNTDH